MDATIQSSEKITCQYHGDTFMDDDRMIIVNDQAFTILNAKVVDKEGVDFTRLNAALTRIYGKGGLHGLPHSFIAITDKEEEITARINYEKRPHGIVASVTAIQEWNTCPSIDTILTHITRSKDKGEISPILVVDPRITLDEYGKNKVDDNVPRLDNNPFKGLEAFIGKIYDGSLNVKELEPFKGLRFGWEGDDTAYIYSAEHRGRNLGVTGFSNRLMNIGDTYELTNSLWEIQAIEHKGFEFKNRDANNKEFDQKITYQFKHLKYTPPLPQSIAEFKIVEDDKLFWTKAAATTGYDLKEIPPQYTDKQPLTPWFEGTHLKSGKKIIMGTRWRVYSVDGTHIDKSEPEKVYAALKKMSR